MSCTFLDYIWGGLAAASLASMLMLSVMWLVSRLLFNRVSARNLKWFFHSQYSLIALTLTAGFGLTVYFNPELASGCFAKFNESKDGVAFTRTIAGVWFVSVLLMISIDLAAVFRSRRRLKALSAFKSKNLENCAKRLGVGRGVELLVSDENHSPYIFGWLRHRVVVSRDFLNSEAFTPVLAHELAHARDYDSLWMLPERFCRRLLFFNPLVYILNSSYQLTVERAADEMAIVKGGVAPRRLAEALVSVAESVSLEPSAMKLGVGRCYRDLRIRIEALAQKHRPSEGLTAVLGAALLLSACAAWAQVEMNRRPKSQAMCLQVEHEKAIESLFQIETEPPVCEGRKQ